MYLSQEYNYIFYEDKKKILHSVEITPKDENEW